MDTKELQQYKFFEGQELKAIMIGDIWVRINPSSKSDLDRYNYESITVIMENGQIGLVPWVLVKYRNDIIQKFNLAYMTGVEV
jgi:hypothetical protein